MIIRTQTILILTERQPRHLLQLLITCETALSVTLLTPPIKSLERLAVLNYVGNNNEKMYMMLANKRVRRIP
jgi:hypothetical protein